jgi:3'-5' exoribonuclease
MTPGKPPLSRLSELAPGQRGDFFALLVDRQRGLTREGKPYYHCHFRDARRTVSFMAWSDDRWFTPCEKEWQAGQFFKVRGVYQQHERYGPQIEIHNIRIVTDTDREDGFDEAQFVETSRHDPAHLLGELRTLAAKHIPNEALRGLVLAVLEKHAPALARLPATKDRAYPYRGGWLEHTLSVTRLAVDLAERYAHAWPELRPPLNVGLVTAAAILHDIGRVRELSEEALTPSLTVEGRVVGHVLLGRDLVREAARDRGLDGELLLLLEHVLLVPLGSALGQRGALIPEGLILHHADELDIEMAQYVRLLERDLGPGPFTERDPGLGRALLKGRSV